MFGGTNLSVGRRVILGSRLGCRRAYGRRRAFRRARLSFRANTQARADRSLRNWACSEDSVSMRRRPVIQISFGPCVTVQARSLDVDVSSTSHAGSIPRAWCRLHALEEAGRRLPRTADEERCSPAPTTAAKASVARPGRLRIIRGASFRARVDPRSPVSAGWKLAAVRLRSERRRHRGSRGRGPAQTCRSAPVVTRGSASVFAASSRRATSRAR